MFEDSHGVKVGYMMRDSECGYDEDIWVASHELVFGNDVESWLSDLTTHSRAADIAADIVTMSRIRP